MKNTVLILAGLLITTSVIGQSLDKMEWFNVPEEYSIDGEKLVMQVTPKSDYWRKTHYGFVVDDGPFFYQQRGGEFEASVMIV